MAINWGSKEGDLEKLELLSPKKHFKSHEIQEFQFENEFKPKKTPFGTNMFGMVKRVSDDKKFMMFLKDEYDLPKLEEAYGESSDWKGKNFYLKCIPSEKGNPYFILGIPEGEINLDADKPF